MNPFENVTGTGYFTDEIKNQVSCLNIDDVLKVDIGNKSIADFRMTLRYVCEGNGFKFKTKKDVEGSLWIKRIL